MSDILESNAELQQSNNGVYTTDEQNKLDTIYKVKEDIVKSMTSNGIPGGARDIEVLNTVLLSMSKDIHDKAILRLKHKDTQNKEAIIDNIAAIMKNIQKRNAERVQNTNRVVEVSDSVIPTNIVDGETEIGNMNIELETIMNTIEE